MKRKKARRTFGVIKSVFNVRQWSDYDRLKAFTTYIGETIKTVFVPTKIVPVDTTVSFENAKIENNLTDEGLNKRKNALLRLSLLMCCLGILILGYAIYQASFGTWKAAMVSMVISMIGFVLAFRYHFWYFQIKERKLGCTFKEWYQKGFLGKKS